MNINACLSKNTDDWRTPTDLYNIFINELGCVDPCPYMCACDNLFKDIENARVFINPPFSKNKDWFKYAELLLDQGKKVYLLVPVRSDTSYFYDLCSKNCVHIYFIKGRLHFNDSNSAPFPSCLIVLDENFTQNYIEFVTYDELKYILSHDFA